MTRTLRKLSAACAAATSLEFALVALPLMMITFGTVESARLIWTRQALQTAATEAARCIGVRASDCTSGGAYSSSNATSYAQQIAAGWGVTLPGDDLTMSRTAASGVCTGMSEVSISYTFQTAVPGLLPMLSGASALTAHACFPNQS